MARAKFNRAVEDVGNILAMEHINVTVPDQQLATFFYVTGLGFTRDPYMDFGPRNVWINVGDQQFHLPTSEPQVLRGRTGVVVPDLVQLEGRLARIEKRLADTAFSFKSSGRGKNRTLDVTCPWGNRIRCHEPGKLSLGIPYIEFEVPVGTSAGIARFYEQVMGVATTTLKNRCSIAAGRGQELVFRETRKYDSHYDGHHIAIYVADFSGPHAYLRDKGLVSEESDQHQYRFQTIIDPDTGEALFEIEHEVRSLFHPMYARNLVNRNAGQTFFTYRQGRDAFVP